MYFRVLLNVCDLSIHCQLLSLGNGPQLRALEMFTYVWVPANPLDNTFIKVSSITHKTSSNIVCMSESAERCDRKLGLGSFLEIPLGVFDLNVLVLDPVMMKSC